MPADKILHEAVSEAESQLEKEQQDVERSITDIVELQVILCSLPPLNLSLLFSTQSE